MGVKGLQSYMEKDCGGGGVFFEVNIKKIVEQFSRGTIHTSESKPPLILVDACCTYRRIYSKGNLTGVYGCQYAEHERMIVQLVESLRKTGAEPIFFFDGPVMAQKRNEWFNRKIQLYDDIQDTMTKIWQGEYDNENPDCFYFPAGMNMFERYVLSQICKCKVVVTLEECDEEIAVYAKENSNVVAILSQDSDFVIYNAANYYLSAKHLNLAELTTKAYSSVRLAEKHNLDPYWLPVLATLLGNDLLLKEHLKAFHLRITHRRRSCYPRHHRLIPAVAKVINRKLKKGMSVDKISRILNSEVFGVKAIEKTRKSIKISLQTYLFDNAQLIKQDKTLSEGSQQLLDAFMSSKSVEPLTLEILVHSSISFDTAFEDPNSGLKQTVLIYRDIISRYCGVLLKHEEKKPERKTVAEFAVYSEHPVKQGTEVPVVFPPFDVDLFALFTSTEADFKSLRVKTLLWAITGCEHFNPTFFSDAEELLQKMKPDYVIPSLVLYFLHCGKKIINKTVVDWFIRMFIVLDLGLCTDSSEPQRCADYDAIQVCTLFERGVDTVACLVSVLGPLFPPSVFARSNNFDGVLFQKIFKGKHCLDELLEKKQAKVLISPILDFLKLKLT